MDYQIKSITEIKEITEKEFAPMVTKAATDFFRFFNYLRKNNWESLVKKNYSDLAQICHGLECFLDDHGARENKGWTFFAELIASMRNLAIAAYTLRHVLDRQPDYHCKQKLFTIEDFV